MAESMADIQGRNSGTGNRLRSPTRLQEKAPASIQVSRASFSSGWKIAIPLLTPLVVSPTSPNTTQWMVEVLRTSSSSSSSSSCSGEESRQQQQQDLQIPEAEKSIFKGWQHPAAPFFYEPAPLVLPFS
ncbi:PREDICTED: uncharacterized protein At4g14450, chloroplastic-like [Nelumbo nucifera]|uniref:Uncharacterized protein At4g14450, chloroplastic-like n=2 Tax=Nelumbo nucifera TaxID=4432 RepID=A0A1U8A532_NELNU|nr:PREDICTED: uncharacterized protein At4g14450, chloroplastic-like [Nelumbo nucifera]DAD36739.1 TPA_asm: hypothetical protein HUJ06_007380 [Nelumbo nucifera]